MSYLINVEIDSMNRPKLKRFRGVLVRKWHDVERWQHGLNTSEASTHYELNNMTDDEVCDFQNALREKILAVDNHHVWSTKTRRMQLTQLENEFIKAHSGDDSYPSNLLWSVTFLFMDIFSNVFVLLALLIYGTTIPGPWLERSMEMDHSAIATTLLLLMLYVVLSFFLMAAFLWRMIRDLLLVHVSNTAPSEALVLLLEWERNAYTFHRGILVRFAMLVRVIAKARNNEYDKEYSARNEENSDEEIGDKKMTDEQIAVEVLAVELRSLLLATSVVGQEDGDYSWDHYNHNEWELKSLWPTEAYNFGFVAVLLMDLLLPAGVPKFCWFQIVLTLNPAVIDYYGLSQSMMCALFMLSLFIPIFFTNWWYCGPGRRWALRIVVQDKDNDNNNAPLSIGSTVGSTSTSTSIAST